MAASKDQELGLYQQARLTWTPAHDPRWLGQAGVAEASRAWVAAACYADTDPAAARALRRCEDRLRALHPYAMARYDRLRAEGLDPLDAMREAAPLFERAPHTRTGGPAPTRPALRVGSAPDLRGDAPGQPLPPDDAMGPAARAEERAREIAARLQAQAHAAGQDELGPAELATVLETVTNLPTDIIERVAEGASRDDVPRHQQATSRTAAQLAAVSFPHTAADASSTIAQARPGLSTTRPQTRRRGPHM